MYNINGKVYTDATFIDEIVHNSKLIMNGIVVKNSELADNNETEESIRLSDIYISIKKGNRVFELFDYTYESLSQLGIFTDEEMMSYEIDNTKIPEQYREQLFDIQCSLFMDSYEELNNYYRAIIGLPPLDSDGNAFIRNLGNLTVDG